MILPAIGLIAVLAGHVIAADTAPPPHYPDTNLTFFDHPLKTDVHYEPVQLNKNVTFDSNTSCPLGAGGSVSARDNCNVCASFKTTVLPAGWEQLTSVKQAAPAKVAYDCLLTIPVQLNARWVTNILHKVVQFHSSLDVLKEHAPGGIEDDPAVDLEAEIEEVDTLLYQGKIKSEYEFEQLLSDKLDKARDANLVWKGRLLAGAVGWQRDISINLISVLVDADQGPQVPEIYLATDLGSARASPVRTINGQPAVDFIKAEANYLTYQDKHTRYNAMFARAAGDLWNRFINPSRYPGPWTNITLDDGRTFNTVNMAYPITRNDWLTVSDPLSMRDTFVARPGTKYSHYLGGPVFERRSAREEKRERRHEDAKKRWRNSAENGSDRETDELVKSTTAKMDDRHRRPSSHHKKSPSGLGRLLSKAKSAMKRFAAVKENGPPKMTTGRRTRRYPGQTFSAPVPYMARDVGDLHLQATLGPVSGWLDRGAKLAVLEIWNFNDKNIGLTVSAFLAFLAQEHAADKLIIDLRGNEGGFQAESDLTFAALFPDIVPFNGWRYRRHEMAGELLAGLSGSFGNHPFSVWNFNNYVTEKLNTMVSWLESYGLDQYGDEIPGVGPGSPVHRYIVPFLLARFGQGSPGVFSGMQISVLTDGRCTSSCATLVEKLTEDVPDGGAYTFAVGGEPNVGTMMPTLGGNHGGQAYSTFEMEADIDIAKASQHDAYWGMFPVAAPIQTHAASVNFRDSIRKAEGEASRDQRRVPNQYITQPADCRIWYQPKHLINKAYLYYSVADIAWGGAGGAFKREQCLDQGLMPPAGWSLELQDDGARAAYVPDWWVPGMDEHGVFMDMDMDPINK